MKYVNEVMLRYSDSDQMGVVYHANYFTFFEQSRTDFLRKQGVEYYDIEKSGYLFPVRDVDCKYISSIRLGEQVFCETELESYSKVRLNFSHVLKDSEGIIKAKGHTSIMCVRKSDFKICKMDQVMPEVYEIVMKMKV